MNQIYLIRFNLFNYYYFFFTCMDYSKNYKITHICLSIWICFIVFFSMHILTPNLVIMLDVKQPEK